jgi:hypothetical protein
MLFLLFTFDKGKTCVCDEYRSHHVSLVLLYIIIIIIINVLPSWVPIVPSSEGGWISPIAGLDVVVERKISAPVGNLILVIHSIGNKYSLKGSISEHVIRETHAGVTIGSADNYDL